MLWIQTLQAYVIRFHILSESITNLIYLNGKVSGEVNIIKNVNTAMKTRIIALEKCQSKAEQKCRMSSVEVNSIPYSVSNPNIEKL